MKNKKVLNLVESAVLITVATVLSILKIVDLPYGGSVTIASMLPVVIISYRHGMGWGLTSGLVFSVIQQLLGLSSLSYVTTWQSILAVVFLDYIIAFLVTGLGGMFRKKVKSQAAALVLGSVVVCLLRYACHVLSGATVWAGISVPTKAALMYSLVYNATYMIPETIVMVIAAFYLGTMIDFRAEQPTRLIRERSSSLLPNILSGVSGLLVSGALIFDVAAVFSKLQDAESGEFNIAQISDVNWVAVITVSAVAAVLAVVLYAVGKSAKKKRNNKTETVYLYSINQEIFSRMKKNREKISFAQDEISVFFVNLLLFIKKALTFPGKRLKMKAN